MLCLFALSMVLSAWALPPDEKKVTLDLKDVPMETFLNTVKQKAGINMLYNSQMFKGVEPVTVKATNLSLGRNCWTAFFHIKVSLMLPKMVLWSSRRKIRRHVRWKVKWWMNRVANYRV